jgi:hypothetical protein
MEDHMETYQDIKAMASDEGIRVTELLALAPQNDPYYTGAPATVRMAEWFRDLWQQFGYTGGVHLRRVHYQVVSTEALLPDGKPYENTMECWNFLCNAGKYARYLGMVPAEAFVDRRNPDPHLNVVGSETYDHEPTVELGLNDDAYTLPEIATDLGNLNWELPAPYVGGYQYAAQDQAYHLELWIEKSTMDDVLLPIGEQYGMNIATSLGFQSITSVIGLLRRIEARGKPARIFYVSDFDPAGDAMPVGVARQIEYWRETLGIEQEVKLIPIALTRDQVVRYQLPTIPVKATDLRRKNFSARYEIDGAVELDALEALHPGTLAMIVQAAVKPYFDRSLWNRLWDEHYQAKCDVQAAWVDETLDERYALADLQERARGIISQYDERLRELAQALAADLAPVQNELYDLRQAIVDKIEDFAPELPDRPQAEPDGDVVPSDAWLYASERDYREQMAVYQARRLGSGSNGAE